MNRLLSNHSAAPLRTLLPARTQQRRIAHHAAVSIRRLEVRCAQAGVKALPANLQKIVGAFQMVPDPMARYKQLLYYAAKLPAMPKEEQVPENKVEGCVSQVWVVPELRDDGKVYWRADSDSQLTKGLAALLVQGLGGCAPEEICAVQPDFIDALGLKQSLTPSRNNGFLNMFRLMQKKALALTQAQAQAQAGQADTTPVMETDAGAEAPPAVPAPPAAAPAPSAAASATPVRDSMAAKLTAALAPTVLDIVDESAAHAGHAGARAHASSGKAGSSGETHFVVTVVSAAFEGQNTVKRHRTVYGLLEQELAGPVHALSLVTRTPEEHGSS